MAALKYLPFTDVFRKFIENLVEIIHRQRPFYYRRAFSDHVIQYGWEISYGHRSLGGLPVRRATIHHIGLLQAHVSGAIGGLIYGLLPMHQCDSVWVPHTEWNELNICFGKVLLLQPVDSAFSIFL